MEAVGFSQAGGAVSMRGRSFGWRHHQCLSCEFLKKYIILHSSQRLCLESGHGVFSPSLEWTIGTD